MAPFMILMLGLGSSLFEMAPGDVDACLKALNARQCDYGARVGELARLAVGTPYAGDPLGEGPGAPYDADPLIDLMKVDCVTFVEQTLALAGADSFETAKSLLQKIRYRGGNVAFENRNHFMEADWVGNNAFCRSVAASLGVATEKATRTLGRRHFYALKKIPELEANAVDQEFTLEYVPVESAAAAAAQLPSPALILLIGKVDWLFTLHCGLYIRDEGKGYLYNASSKQGKVVATPWNEVFANTTRYAGFAAYEIAQPR